MRFNVRSVLSSNLTTAFVGVMVGIYYERKYNLKSNLVLNATSLEPSAQFKPFLSPIKTVDDNLNRTQKIMAHGFPSFENVKNYQNFVVCYDKRTRNANWVIEHLNENTLTNKTGKLVKRQGMDFFPDDTLHPFFRAVNDDFKNSGYDRGHLAAAGNHPLTYEDMSRTFILSNISPQVGVGFNRDIWNVLEVYARYRAKRSRNLWVCTGPLYLAKKDNSNGKNYVKYEVIGKNNVAVPTHFFKVMLIEQLDGSFVLENYVIENAHIKEERLSKFQVPLESIERAAGFLIFDGFPNKNKLKQNEPNKYLDDFKFRKRFPTNKKETPAIAAPAA